MIKVTDEAVDELARILFVREWVPGDWRWEQYPEPNRWQDSARKGLEAVAPHLQVQGNREAGFGGYLDGLRDAKQAGEDTTDGFGNLYRLDWLDAMEKLREDAFKAMDAPPAVAAPVQVDREALEKLFRGPNACGIWLENLLDDREAELIADAVLALLSPEETK